MPGDGENQRILVVDDDARICRLLTRILAAEGYAVETVASGQAMRRTLLTRTFDLIILDLRLPAGEDGLTLAQRLRAESDVPLIMLTGRSEQVDKVVGLEIGADDYVTKPFDRRELIARIRSILRRSQMRSATVGGSDRGKSIIKFAGWTLNFGRRELTSGGDKIELTAFEFQLLSVLVERPGQLLSRDQILELVASRHWTPSDRSIDVHIGKLRRKLRDDPCDPRLIKTIRGIGYMFVPPDADE
jgi:two-component system, OmpR family, response regulator